MRVYVCESVFFHFQGGSQFGELSIYCISLAESSNTVFPFLGSRFFFVSLMPFSFIFRMQIA